MRSFTGLLAVGVSLTPTVLAALNDLHLKAPQLTDGTESTHSLGSEWPALPGQSQQSTPLGTPRGFFFSLGSSTQSTPLQTPRSSAPSDWSTVASTADLDYSDDEDDWYDNADDDALDDEDFREARRSERRRSVARDKKKRSRELTRSEQRLARTGGGSWPRAFLSKEKRLANGRGGHNTPETTVGEVLRNTICTYDVTPEWGEKVRAAVGKTLLEDGFRKLGSHNTMQNTMQLLNDYAALKTNLFVQPGNNEVKVRDSKVHELHVTLCYNAKAPQRWWCSDKVNETGNPDQHVTEHTRERDLSKAQEKLRAELADYYNERLANRGNRGMEAVKWNGSVASLNGSGDWTAMGIDLDDTLVDRVSQTSYGTSYARDDLADPKMRPRGGSQWSSDRFEVDPRTEEMTVMNQHRAWDLQNTHEIQKTAASVPVYHGFHLSLWRCQEPDGVSSTHQNSGNVIRQAPRNSVCQPRNAQFRKRVMEALEKVMSSERTRGIPGVVTCHRYNSNGEEPS